jgi:NAD-dependent SIR2 family protein deacetylase
MSSLESVVERLRACKKVLIVSGAGISVSCGIEQPAQFSISGSFEHWSHHVVRPRFYFIFKAHSLFKDIPRII